MDVDVTYKDRWLILFVSLQVSQSVCGVPGVQLAQGGVFGGSGRLPAVIIAPPAAAA